MCVCVCVCSANKSARRKIGNGIFCWPRKNMIWLAAPECRCTLCVTLVQTHSPTLRTAVQEQPSLKSTSSDNQSDFRLAQRSCHLSRYTYHASKRCENGGSAHTQKKLAISFAYAESRESKRQTGHNHWASVVTQQPQQTSKRKQRCCEKPRTR